MAHSQLTDAGRWTDLDSRHHLHPFTTHKDLRHDGVRVITHADGLYIHDSAGNRILDGMAGLWCVQVGYGNRELADAAYEALKTLPFYNTFSRPHIPMSRSYAKRWPRSRPRGWTISTLPIPGRRRMTARLS